MNKRNPGILLVDNDLENRRWLRKILSKQGWYVSAATDGMAALVRLRNQKNIFHLVLTETQMPCLTGPELVEEIRQRKIKVAIIGMSSRQGDKKLYKYFWNKKGQLKNLLALIKQLLAKQ